MYYNVATLHYITFLTPTIYQSLLPFKFLIFLNASYTTDDKCVLKLYVRDYAWTLILKHSSVCVTHILHMCSIELVTSLHCNMYYTL